MSLPNGWTRPLVLSHGGGTNSTAMLVGLAERRIVPDLILFADTGGEKPHTYAFLDTLDRWLGTNGFPLITRVRSQSPDQTLEGNVTRLGVLPSLAYGWKTCSQRWKIAPQDKFLNGWGPAKEAWDAGKRITHLIGYDADEHHRVKNYDDDKAIKRYPLVDWDWGRDECREAIARAGLPQPGKSACFFCPASRKSEILELRRVYPDLFERALEMERRAKESGKNKTVVGLGRSWSWAELVSAHEQMEMFPEAPEIACGCFDGGDDDG